MKSLLVKDFSLMLQRGRILLFLMIWGVGMTFVMDSSSFVVGWIVCIAAITSLSTISYDEYDNCMPFLLSLPVTRRSYAVEKYLFSVLFGAGFWILSLGVVAVCGLFNGKGFSLAKELPGMVVILALTFLILAVSIPPQLKWGAEKGRIVMLLIYAVFGAGAFFLSRFGDNFSGLGERLSALPMWGVILGALGLCLVLTVLSALISIRIMEKKEF